MKTIVSSLLLAVLFLLPGCASYTSQQLLAEDYKKMNNEELLRYYYRLNDEIDRIEGRSSASEVGFGVGTFGHGSGFGVGAVTGTYGGATADKLRARRVDVKLELKKRGLTP